MSAQQLPLTTRMRRQILTNTTSGRFFLLLLAAGLAGCSNSSSAPPTTPSAPQAGPFPIEIQRPATRLNGVVSDTAFRPLAGARVEIASGPETGAWTTTRADGEFSFTSITVNDTTQVRAALDGYLTATQTVGCCPYYAYFNLALPVPPATMAGEYALTFQADSACTDLPIEMRTRSYTATVTSDNSNASIPSNTWFYAVLEGAPFILDKAGFWIGVAGHYVAFLIAEGEDPWIVEEFASNAYVAIGGVAAATVGPAFSTISAPFDGSIEYCELRSPMGMRYSCDSPVARARARCTSKNHRLTLTRR